MKSNGWFDGLMKYIPK